MKQRWFWLAVPVFLAACDNTGRSPEIGEEQARGFDPPVVTNPEPPVEYPVDLFEQQIEGVVLLYLFIDDQGSIVPESTRVEEGSGYTRLDSAALRSVELLRFAPARRDGVPVATAFVQPVHFRHPALAAAGENR